MGSFCYPDTKSIFIPFWLKMSPLKCLLTSSSLAEANSNVKEAKRTANFIIITLLANITGE